MSCRLLALVLLLLAPLTSAEITSVKLDPDGRVVINDHPAKLWGLRTACAAIKEESTKQLIDALPDLKESGVNVLLVCYQGGPGGTLRTFTPDGSAFEDTAARDRVRRICDAAASHDALVVVSLFFPRKMGLGAQDPKLASRDAYLAACRTAAEELKGRRNVILAACDQPAPGAFATCPMKFTAADIIECLKAGAAVAPHLPRGGGNASHDANLTIAKSDAATVILHAEPGTNPPVFAGIKKPILHVGHFGTNETGGKNPQGFYPPPARQPMVDLLDRYQDTSTAGFCAHFPAWTEGAVDLKTNRFDAGGQGTQKDPGIAWYLDALRKRARRKPETPPGPGATPANTKPGKSIFDN